MEPNVPIVIISRDARGRFTASVNGQEIPNLRTFEIKVSNAKDVKGITEAAYYTVEQYLPNRNTTDSAQAAVLANAKPTPG